MRIWATFVIVLLALGFTGAAGAVLGGSPALRPTLRVVLGGALALAITFALGGRRRSSTVMSRPGHAPEP